MDRHIVAAKAAVILCAATVADLCAAPAERMSRPSLLSPDPVRIRLNDGRDENACARVTASTFGPKRARPVFTGEFKVDVIVIAFPDCTAPDPNDVAEDLNTCRGHTLREYFKKYTLGIAWPALQVFPAVYRAPNPLGYYCRFDEHANPIGFKGGEEGEARAQKLRSDALAYAKSASRAPRGGRVTCFAICRSLDQESVSALLAPRYPKDGSWREGDDDPTSRYRPEIPWADPLWPNSIIQVQYPDGGGTLVHELGHVLGAPDFYHASEEHDGVEGTPALPWSYGPTGPAYCRYIYQAFATKDSYPTFTESGTYTLDPRSAEMPSAGTDRSAPILGCFVPSSHPNYVFYLEYARDERPPVGVEGADGLAVSVINVKMASPLDGPPDLCYTYRRGDRFLKGRGDGGVYLHEGDEFTMKSDPAAVIPPLVPGGIEITDIRESGGKCTFSLSFPKTDRSPKFLKEALLPKIELLSVDDVLPCSMHPRCEVMYRGEPHLSEYGFVWGAARNPTVAKNRYPLYHRERCDAQIYGLSPGTKYYVRAYATSASGTVYSRNEVEVVTPKTADDVAPLLTDRLQGSFFITRWHFGNDRDGYFNSANPVIALMSLGIYYGVEPGASGPGGRQFQVRRVHTSPTLSSPKARLADIDAFYARMRRLSEVSGLMEHGFRDIAKWQRRCAKALKIANPGRAFLHVGNTAELKAAAPRILASLRNSHPVMLVRENTYMPGVTHTTYPLDIALIDGTGRDGRWHVEFPLGCDRGDENVKSGETDADTLMVSVKNACLVFYSPQ